MTYKEKHGTTRLGDFLRNVAPQITNVVGEILPDAGALGVVKNLITNDKKMSAEQKAEALRLLELELENTKDARDMQKVALQQSDVFSKRFVYYLASFWSIIASSYLFLATFTEVVNEKIADTVLGFLLGTIIATVINYFFGSSSGSKEKTDAMASKLFKN